MSEEKKPQLWALDYEYNDGMLGYRQVSIFLYSEIEIKEKLKFIKKYFGNGIVYYTLYGPEKIEEEYKRK